MRQRIAAQSIVPHKLKVCKIGQSSKGQHEGHNENCLIHKKLTSIEYPFIKFGKSWHTIQEVCTRRSPPPSITLISGQNIGSSDPLLIHDTLPYINFSNSMPYNAGDIAGAHRPV